MLYSGTICSLTEKTLFSCRYFEVLGQKISYQMFCIELDAQKGYDIDLDTVFLPFTQKILFQPIPEIS